MLKKIVKRKKKCQLDIVRTCPECGKKFTWRNKKRGQKYCSKICSKNGRKNKGGRRWFDGKEESQVVTKLTYVWGIGGSDAEACSYAGISTASLSRYLEKHPDVSEQKKQLLEKPILKARANWILKINSGDYHASKDYLERKRKEEFSTKVINENKNPPAQNVTILIPDNGRN